MAQVKETYSPEYLKGRAGRGYERRGRTNDSNYNHSLKHYCLLIVLS